jgi:hypothetical protein
LNYQAHATAAAKRLATTTFSFAIFPIFEVQEFPMTRSTRTGLILCFTFLLGITGAWQSAQAAPPSARPAQLGPGG